VPIKCVPTFLINKGFAFHLLCAASYTVFSMVLPFVADAVLKKDQYVKQSHSVFLLPPLITSVWLHPSFLHLSVPYRSPSTSYLIIMANQQDKDEFNSEAIHALAEKCDLLVNQVAIGEISQGTFYSRLCETGISPEAATDYTEMMIQQVQSHGHHTPPRQSDSQTPPGSRPSSPFQNRASTPEGLEGDDLLDFHHRHDALLQAQQGRPRDNALSQQEVADEVAWATLRAKIGQLRPPDISSPSTNRSATQFAESLSTLFRDSHASDSTAFVAPHLAHIAGGARNDVHLKKTRDIRVLFKSDSFRDSTITNAQLAPLNEPLPRSIWKKIVLEEFVDFTKLFASMDQGYNHYDEPEDFAAGFAIIKKNHLSAKHDVVSEADWIHVFDAWKDGVLIFPHRATELQGYHCFVMDIFCSTPLNPAAAIRFDCNTHDWYVKQPFHMDDRSLLHLPLLTELFAAANSFFVSPSTSLKQPLSSSTTTTLSKQSDVPCHNWNWGNCKDPCSNCRKHGHCCICGEEHQAKENPACLAKLQNRALENIP
jgi:hypothetical protein